MPSNLIRMNSTRGGVAWIRSISCLGLLAMAVATSGQIRFPDQESTKRGMFPQSYDTQPEDIPLLTPEQARRSLTVPAGFNVSLFAAEPWIQQPIAMATDERGRLWVAENYTYAERERDYDTALRDRIVILEDTNHDGQFDRRTVFWDQAVRLTSIEIGFGGVWALCAPDLLFIPDANHDDIPDGPPVVQLDGWNGETIRHNIVNGLRWGPDGWLYGRHGITATSLVGTPGTQPEQRVRMDCGVWRFHPTEKKFEVVCRGTTNPWGMDWDDHGQLFFINTVIGHLWHVVPGAYMQRMYGEHFDPDLFELIGQTADHFHWDTTEAWSDIKKLGVTKTTDQAGGGHAHCGMMIYLGNQWPVKYRNQLFTANLHGRRINVDRLERAGATYTGLHEPDILAASDPWFRCIELCYGPDGGVYLADWSDIGECHDNDGIHRGSGRIYKMSYGQGRGGGGATGLDLSKLDNAELVQLQLRPNDWFVRQSRRLLHERSLAATDFSDVHSQLFQLFEQQTNDVTRQLRALWCLHVTGGLEEAWLIDQLGHQSEHVRTWAIQLLVDDGVVSPTVQQAFERQAKTESSGLVLTFLASSLRRMSHECRWTLATTLAERDEFANDRVYPLIVWYGIEPAVVEQPEAAVKLIATAQIPKIREYVARRLTAEIDRQPLAVDALVKLLVSPAANDARQDILTGMSMALQGWRQAQQPASWAAVSKTLSTDANDAVRAAVRELSLVFGDGRAMEELREIAASKPANLDVRRAAIRALVASRDSEIVPLLQELLRHRELASDAAQGLAAFNHPRTAELLIDAFGGFRQLPREAAMAVLVSRGNYAAKLLEAVADGKIDRRHVSSFQLRQMQTLNVVAVDQKMLELWPELKKVSAEKLQSIAAYRKQLTPETLANADPSAGRVTFQRTCLQCHKLFGEGGNVGPDLTGAQRHNLSYLLENIIDPSATVSKNFHMSVVITERGRVLNGIVTAQTDRTLTLQTPTDRLLLAQDEIQEIRKSSLSMMPERMLDGLTSDQARDLIAYLMSQQQVPLPDPSTTESVPR
jgi:putative membrane-bound dehydrogenase-like protein